MSLTKPQIAMTVLLILGLDAGGRDVRAAGALTQGKGMPPVKIEFAGWFSNPVFTADSKNLVFAQMAALPYGARTGPTQIIVLSAGTGKEVRRLEGPSDDSLLGPVALSADGKRLALGLWNTAVRLWDLDGGKAIGRVDGSRGAQRLCFAPDGSSVAWLQNGEIHLAEPATAKELRHFAKDADGPVIALAFTNGGKSVISGHSQSTDVSGPGAGKNRTFKHQINYWARDAVSGKKQYQVGDTVTEMRKSLEGPPLAVLFPSADGKTVLLAGDRGVIQVCDASTGKKQRELAVPWTPQADDPIRWLAISGSGQRVAVATARGVVSVWDLSAGKEVPRLETGHSIDHLVLSPDGKSLALTYQVGGKVGAVLLIYAI
jgi:WD40 repeat protein